MIEFINLDPVAKTFTLSINGRSHTYPADKEGKRQAILDGLKVITPLTVGDAVYLSADAALQVVATILHPEGIQTEAEYQTVCQVTDRACAHAGYGVEEQLGPPTVSFAQRGSYRKQFPALDTAVVLGELEAASCSSYLPRQEIQCRQVWNKVAWEIYNQPWAELSPAQQTQLQSQVDALAVEAGWAIDEAGRFPIYIKPLMPDMEGAKTSVTHYLNQSGGQPVPERALLLQVQKGAYGRTFYEEELGEELQTAVSEVLQSAGYETVPVGGQYRPLPVVIPPEAEPAIMAALAGLEPVNTDYGPCILLRDVVDATGVASMTDWQAEQLVEEGIVSRMLRQLGYQTELTWCQAYSFQPRLEDSDRFSVAQQVILKEVRVQNDPNRKISLAKGLAVFTPALAIDDDADTLVYLEMVGAKQSVKANWAALVGGGKVHWLGRKRIRLSGMKEHVKIQATLPCGWANQVLLHKQASLKEMNPEQPFYLLDDGTQPIPPLFYPMLNKALALPVLPDWAGHLWENGRRHDLITLLDDGQGQGVAAWRVLPAAEEWQGLVQAGIVADQIAF